MAEANSEVKTIEFHSLRGALDHVKALGEKAAEAVAEYQQAYFELTGLKANQPMGALDVIAMIMKESEAKGL